MTRPWLAMSLAAMCLASPALAQRGHGKGAARTQDSISHEAPLEVFERMTPDDREKAMATLPPERRRKLQQQLKLYDQLTPAQKNQLDWFNHLPPGRQEAFRKVYKKFVNEPPERQQTMREEMSRLSALPIEERQTRLASPEVRERFSKNEQQILGQMSEALPHD